MFIDMKINVVDAISAARILFLDKNISVGAAMVFSRYAPTAQQQWISNGDVIINTSPYYQYTPRCAKVS